MGILKNGMILYHGSCFEFERLDLCYAKPGKDFGKGIYMTTHFEQAKRWAGRENMGYVYTYRLEGYNEDEFRVLQLLQYDEEWLDLIAYCRIEEAEPSDIYSEEYDIIYDRMADGTNPELTAAIRKYYKEKSIIQKDVKEAKRLEVQHLREQLAKLRRDTMQIVKYRPNQMRDQYCFKNQEAVNLLRRIRCEQVG